MATSAVFDAVFAAASTDAGDAFSRVSSFLVFSLAGHRAAVELRGAVAVDEWVGPHRRLPVLGAGQLAEFLADRWRRLFLAELLASYTHGSSGTRWEKSVRGWRRRRFSELDPVQLASLVDAVPAAECLPPPGRPGPLPRRGVAGLERAPVPGRSPGTASALGRGRERPARTGRPLQLGGGRAARVLGSAVVLAGVHRLLASTASLRVVADVADRFGQARRTLNLLADRYLAP